MKKLLFGFAALSILSFQIAVAAPAQVIILRHAEKQKNSDDLSPIGYERADALKKLFLSDRALTQYGAPVAIYAMSASSADSSKRAEETVQPLADSLGLHLQDQYTVDEIQPLIGAIMNDSSYDGKTVVICWEHKRIPEIVSAFGYDQAPAKWNKKVFDRIWVLDFSSQGKVVQFEDLPQNLLPGDSQY